MVVAVVVVVSGKRRRRWSEFDGKDVVEVEVGYVSVREGYEIRVRVRFSVDIGIDIGLDPADDSDCYCDLDEETS